ncbi:MAG: DUF1549 domain-containing protein [Planctomycetes bacterium]|nr:DUF1549 domain-containing protein [Planctomycetota bacterium]
MFWKVFGRVFISGTICSGAWLLAVAADAPQVGHWAWRKPVCPALPAVKRTEWPRNPIDYFVLARLEQDGLCTSPEADRYTLIRRMWLDLIGLPPSPQQVEEFVKDTRPEAYERLVDRLLADQGYGERWARMWLDLARYADSKGYGSDPLRTIWRYRDWVIDAFNRNMPYDQFTIEQIAGDLLPNPTHEQLLATAFHRNTMANDEGGTDDEQFRVEAVKDRVDSTMQIWMGITMGCAKCHTHKYDPITNREYYQFFAFFNQSEDADRNDEEPRLRSPSQQQQEQMDRIKAELASLRQKLESPAPELAAGQAKWEEDVAAQAKQWTVLVPQEFKAANGTQFQKLDDHSLLATGNSPETDTYTIVAQTDLKGLTALRVETLPHECLPQNGPGRADGKFVLNDLRVTAAGRADKPLAGRFVRVEIPGQQRILSLAEVQAFKGSENIATKGKATQSSTDYDGPPQLAIDGNTNGHYFEAKSTTHTKAEDNPWWEVDLGGTSELDQIVIWNRTDGGVGTRLNNFRVALLSDDRKPVWETKVADPPSPNVQVPVGGPGVVPLQNPTADFDQAEFPVSKAIDSDAGAKSGWAVAPQTGKPHMAVFELSKPAGSDSGTTLTFTLTQSYGSGHTIGRLRLSATTASPPPRALPGRTSEILAVTTTDRTAEQVAELADYHRSIAPQLQPVRDQIAKLDQQLKDVEKQVPLIPIMRELPSDKRRQTQVLIKANFLLKGDPVEAAVPAAFHPIRRAGVPPANSSNPATPDSGLNRLDLANWLVDPGNPVTARAAVNRFWSQLFGRGLVQTEEDFGTQGLAPSHPELLDWLAVQFMEGARVRGSEFRVQGAEVRDQRSEVGEAMSQPWDIKTLLRLIVTSATYRQSSTPTPELLRRDPDNRLLARGPRHRLEAEMVRDQALALAGLLSRKIGGPSVYPPQPPGLWRAAFNGDRTWATSTGEDRYRRGLYTFWRRTVPYPSMATFDAPSREICTLRRTPTNTPLQAFVTLNDPVYVEAAQALARRIVREGGSTVEDRAAYGLRVSLCRPLSPEQVREIVSLYQTELELYRNDSAAAQQFATEPLGPLPEGMPAPELAAWTVVGNVLLNLDGVLAKR